MNTSEIIRHQQLAAFLLGKTEELSPAVVEDIRKKNPSYNLLFEIISTIRKHREIDLTAVEAVEDPPFEKVEDMLLQLISGESQEQDEQQFLKLLVSSPTFYRRLMEKLDTIAPRVEFEPVEEIREGVVSVRSDDELLDVVLAQARTTEPNRVEAAGVGIVQSILDKIDQLAARLRPAPRYAFAIPALAALVLVSYFVLRGFMESPLSQYRWDTDVPYQTTGIALRGAEAIPEANLSATATEALTVHQQLKDLLTLGLGSYLRTDYQQMIATLERGLTSLLSLQQALPQVKNELSGYDSNLVSDMQKLVQNYYFYLGVGSMALSQTRKVDLSENERQQYRQKALTFLVRAREFADRYDISTSNREDYFLGLTYALSHEIEAARNVLENIPQDSEYYSDARALMKQMTR